MGRIGIPTSLFCTGTSGVYSLGPLATSPSGRAQDVLRVPCAGAGHTRQGWLGLPAWIFPQYCPARDLCMERAHLPPGGEGRDGGIFTPTLALPRRGGGDPGEPSCEDWCRTVLDPPPRGRRLLRAPPKIGAFLCRSALDPTRHGNQKSSGGPENPLRSGREDEEIGRQACRLSACLLSVGFLCLAA
jgi:hypothetical protein